MVRGFILIGDNSDYPLSFGVGQVLLSAKKKKKGVLTGKARDFDAVRRRSNRLA